MLPASSLLRPALRNSGKRGIVRPAAAQKSRRRKRSAAMSQIVRRVEGRVHVLTLNRPEKRNAITRAMYAALTAALREAEDDAEVHAVVITGAGDHFTAGNDIADFLASPKAGSDTEAGQFLNAISAFSKPLLAAVAGNAVGIGTTLLLHCDVVVAQTSASFSMPFASLGLVPEAASSYLFPRLVGYQRAAKVFMTGERFGAQEAKDMGLVASVAEDALAEAIALATHIAKQPRQAILDTKRLLKASEREVVAATMQAELEVFSRALKSDEARAILTKFVDKKSAR
jgi:enoyl-CoA hydratase/carnithine racemase